MAEASDYRFKDHLTRPTAVVTVGPQDERVTADLENKAADQGLDFFSGRSIGESLAVSSRQMAATRTPEVVQASPPRPMVAKRQLSRIAIKAKGTILFIDSADIIAVEVEGNYISVRHTSGSYVVHESITTAERKLNLHGFVRIHRSVLVNPAFVEELRSWSTGQYALRVKGGKEYKVTRTYKTNLQFLAESWIGTDSFIAR
jgi:two-component system LytT family response regulator